MYFPLFKRHGWGKRLGEGRRHNGAMMPLIDGFIILKFSGFSTGNLSAILQARGKRLRAADSRPYGRIAGWHIWRRNSGIAGQRADVGIGPYTSTMSPS